MQKNISKVSCSRTCCLGALAALAGFAWAGPADGPTGQPAARQAQAPADLDAGQRIAAPAPPRPVDALGFGPAADVGKLERSRGGTDTHADLSGIVTNNSAVNVVTGNNVIDAGSFANMAGIPVVIQNSGANVLIQNSTIINLQMK
jgi:hypothetical protein